MSDESVRQKQEDEVFCSSCGAIIKKVAEICPKCGVRQFAAPSAQPASGNQAGPSKGVAGLVLGILSAAGGWIPGLNYVAWAIGIVGIVLSVLARKKAIAENQPTSMATAGLVLSIVGTALSLIGLCVCTACVGAAAELSDPSYWL